MVFELRSLDKARFIFKTPTIHLALEQILAGVTSSPVYVDDINQPKSAVTWTNSCVYLAGDPMNNEFIKYFNVVMNAQFFQAFLVGSKFNVYPDSPKWIPVLKQQFWDLKVKDGVRRYYESELKDNYEVSLPLGYNIVDVTYELVRKPLKNIENLLKEMISEYESVEEALKRVFGVAAISDEELAGWCLSEYNLGNRFEVGLETIEDHRWKGIATAMGKTLANKAKANGYEHLGWHCWTWNEASNATAIKLGLKLVAEYPALLVALN